VSPECVEKELGNLKPCDCLRNSGFQFRSVIFAYFKRATSKSDSLSIADC